VIKQNFHSSDALITANYNFGRLSKIIEAHAIVHRCVATVDFMEEELQPYPATVNDEGMYHHAREVAEAMLGEGNVRRVTPFMGAEDFAFYAQRFAGAFFMIGSATRPWRWRRCIPCTPLAL